MDTVKSENVVDEQKHEKKYVTPYISNKRFSIIKNRLEGLLESKTNECGVPYQPLLNDILQVICDETNYDPNIKKYTPELGKKEMEYRKQKAKELGISLYELAGRKKGSQYYKEKK